MRGTVKSAHRHYHLSLELTSPESFYSQVSYGVSSSYRQIEVSESMRQWLDLTE
ncbi:MAG: hypothetical protein NWR21_04920 [Verrucomicrobiales bacterium]|jgi:hypothetical protein|nr:hypothetical protein [Verrucomicrobiales bacterium]MDP4793356.1 hypothetical protein [Verrucomicrobiales bacterium]MDP4938636.1 hypothetical protein [Verrucomicrobiales bacterium]MDP5006872.1 hypothetical protein [Verrucomicrobiales bacterium]